MLYIVCMYCRVVMGIDTVCWTTNNIEVGHSSFLMFSLRGRRPDFGRLSVKSSPSKIFNVVPIRHSTSFIENERKRQNEGAEMLETI